MFEIVALLIGTITTFLIALTVYTKNNHSLTSKMFFGLALSLIGWSVSTYFSLHTQTDEQTLLWQRPVMFFVVAQNSFFFLLVQVYPKAHSELFKKTKYKLAIIYSLLTAAIAASPLLFVDFQDGGPVPGPGMALFLPHALIFAVGGIILLAKRFFKARGVEKIQLGYFFAGTVLLYTLVPIGNFIAPVVFKLPQLVTISPLYSVIFSGLFAYGIISKKLFDIKTAVVRTVAYVLSLGFTGLIYGAIIFTGVTLIGADSLTRQSERLIFIGLALVLAFTFPATKRFFDRLTTRFFFQDAYDSSEFLDKANKLLVGQIELDTLLTGITSLIEQHLKSSYCVFVIRETAYEDVRIVGTEKHHFNTGNLKELRALTPHVHRKLLVTDELDEYTEELGGVMRSLDISVLIRLVSNTSYDIEGMGYLVIGPKKNGTIYSQQDKQVLEILSNEMVIAIENALRFEEIEKFNVTLQEKIDDATKKLRKTNEKLKALDETKDEFISMASHQLRTPLTSVKGYLSMVLEGDTGEVPEMQRKMLDQAFVSSQRMVYLIADLLNVSRLRTGKFIIDQVPTQLADVVDDEVTQLQETAKARKLTLKYDKPTDFPVLPLDETKIRQVIMNFLDNAIYYTPAGGEINVELTDDGKVVEYKVVDNGIGISKWEQAHLFSKFFRAGNAKKARPDGTGLGLFMAKKVIVASGGSIIFRSAEGKGSTFGFAFEKARLEKMATEQNKKDEVTHPKPTDTAKK